MQMFLKLISAFFFIYFLYCVLVFVFQRHVLFPRYMIENIPLENVAVQGIEKTLLKTGSGKVEAWFIPPLSAYPGKPSPVVIFAHGNGELIDFWPEELSGFAKLGIGVLLVEYPGYGRSEGSPSQKSIAEAFVAAHDYISVKKGIDPSRIILLGRSIGGGAVCALSKRRPSAALILMSTFTSIRSFAPGYFVPGFIMRDPFDNLEAVRTYSAPVMIIHGKNDEIIPFVHGITLSKAARNCTMIEYECGHNDCPPDPVAFWKDVESFIRKSGLL